MLASVADHLQAMAATWRGKWPHVTNALIAQATTRLNAALTPPAPARAIPRPIFSFPAPPLPFAAPAAVAELLQLRCRHSGAQACAEPPFRHRRSITVFPVTPCASQCPRFKLGKRQHHAAPRQSSAASPVTMATSAPSTTGHASALDSFPVAQLCSSEL